MTDPTEPKTDAEPTAKVEPTEAPEAETPDVAAAADDTDDTAETDEATSEAADEEAEEAIVAAEPAPAARPRTARAPRGPRPYAVIETGGKQYRVSVGDTISVEKLDGETGADVIIDRVLLLGGDGAPRVGTPLVTGATVTARIDEQFRGQKITIFKYKPKKRYRKKMGHRQPLTRLEITAINA